MPASAQSPTHQPTHRQEGHSHLFLGAEHHASERRTWAVIWLCGVMMVVEIIGGLMFGSIALVADGLHMSTHAAALLLAALAFLYARKHAHDPRFSFGTGKLGDLAGFSSAIILAMIALLIGYEAITRLFAPVPIHYGEAIAIAGLGLVVNVASAWLLSGGPGHHHHHHHHHDEGDGGHHDHEARHHIATPQGPHLLEIIEAGVPPRFRLRHEEGAGLDADAISIETVRPDGSRQIFRFAGDGDYLDSIEEIPEPHEFTALLRIGDAGYQLPFAEHEHAGGAVLRDNNMRAAVIHVLADAAVSVLVILGLTLARLFGWVWMDPVAGIIGAAVIAAWSYGLIRDTGAILLDMTADRAMAENLRRIIEADGDRLADLHVWRLGPGHLGAIVSVVTDLPRDAQFYRARLAHFTALSHLTVEIARR